MKKIKQIFKNFLCAIGIHDWVFIEPEDFGNIQSFYCDNCGYYCD